MQGRTAAGRRCCCSAWAALGPRWSAAAVGAAGLEKTPLVRHPLAVALTLNDAVRFLAAHAARHRRQLARTARRAPA